MITTLYHEPFGWVARVCGQGGGSSGAGSVWGPGQAGPSLVAVRFTQKQVEFMEEIAAN
jgi:hypothetical protein